jgi:hypothetical protein
MLKHFIARPYTGILHSYMPETSSVLRFSNFRRADAGKFRKGLKIKMTGKTAGNSPHGEGRAMQYLDIFSNLGKKYNGHCFVYSLLIIFILY